VSPVAAAAKAKSHDGVVNGMLAGAARRLVI
jgi:hypothetical protein